MLAGAALPARHRPHRHLQLTQLAARPKKSSKAEATRDKQGQQSWEKEGTVTSIEYEKAAKGQKMLRPPVAKLPLGKWGVVGIKPFQWLRKSVVETEPSQRFTRRN